MSTLVGHAVVARAHRFPRPPSTPPLILASWPPYPRSNRLHPRRAALHPRCAALRPRSNRPPTPLPLAPEAPKAASEAPKG